MNIKWDLTISTLLFWLISSPALATDMPAIKESMGNKHECEQYPKEIHWISEKTSALVIGKSEDSVKVCRLKFGLATAKDGARVRLSFDFMYNHICGVYLQINESATSDFFTSTTNREMFMSSCYTNDPGPLFAQPKNFILISLVKENENMEAYNFRLNISMAENLPSRGPELHIVIIVGFVLFTVVALSAILLYKYIVNLTYHWHDERVDTSATRAINIYNSQEHLNGPSNTYLRPAGAQGYTKPCLGDSVHSNGHIERLDGPRIDKRDIISRKAANSMADQRLSESQNHPHNHQQHRSGHKGPSVSFQPATLDLQQVASPAVVIDVGDTASLGGCDIPPSYEEALGMPLATELENDMDEDGMDIAVGGCLELDYLNESIVDPSIKRGTTQSDGNDVFT